MEITSEYVYKFKKLYQEHYGVELTDTEAARRAYGVVYLVAVVYGVDDLLQP